MTLPQQWLPEFDDEMTRTRKVLAAVPKAELDWSPGGKLHTIGWNANHLVELVGWTIAIVGTDEYDPAPPGGGGFQPLRLDDPVAIVATFDKNVAAARDAIAGLSDEAFARPWTLKMGGQAFFTMPKGPCIRKWVLNHAVHHRAILSTLLRQRGVELTPVYDQ